MYNMYGICRIFTFGDGMTSCPASFSSVTNDGPETYDPGARDETKE